MEIDYLGCTHLAGSYGSGYVGAPLRKDIRVARANKKIGYLGNPKIKRADIKIKMSQDEVNEYIKCSEDPIYFIRAYMKIVNIDGGLIMFDMYDFQENMIHNMHDNRFSIQLACRQSGKTISTTAYLLWFVLFNSYKNVGLLANKKSNATKALARLKLAYEKMPMWLQQGVISWNKGDIELENGSRVTAYAASSDAARGESFSMLYADEIAFVPSTIWDEYYKSSYPTIASGKSSKIMLSSTPNGMNHYYSLVQGARNGTNTYSITETVWSDVPGRNEDWKKETIKNTSDEAFLQEHENHFLGNSSTLIPGPTLRNLVAETVLSVTENMVVVENPMQGHSYFMTVDVAQGLGLDYSALSVIDVTEYPFKQVATYRDNTISQLVYPDVIERIARRYNNAHVLVETNDVGVQVAQILNWDFEYENLLSTKDTAGRRSKIGLRVNRKTKRIGCNRLRDMVVSQKLQITTEDTINELYAFQQKNDSYEAEYGCDDLTMGLVNFAYYVSQPGFAMMVNPNRFKDEYVKQFSDLAMESLAPLPMVDTGIAGESAEAIEYRENGFIDGSYDSAFMS